MEKKITVGIIYGGVSFEHNISIDSSINIINNIDKKKFDIVIIGINKNGTFHIENFNEKIINIKEYLKNILNKNNNILNIKFNKNVNFYSNIFKKKKMPDVFFPITHGYFGEDGNIQSILNLFNIPFIGSNLKSSCLGINKDLTKFILMCNNLPVVPFLIFDKYEISNISFEYIKKKFGNFFIKPSNQGSSIGITLVKTKKNFLKSINKSFNFSNKIIIEPLIKGKEIECGVLDNYGKLNISECAEIVKKNYFYTYKDKYINNKTKIVIPAKIDNNLKKVIKNYTLKIFNLFECKGMLRVDFFITKNFKIFINEVNTIPGFTKNSVYIKFWEKNKINLKKLLSILINSSINKK